MDLQEHSDQVMTKLVSIEGQLRSLRYVFGIGIIILTLVFIVLAPTLYRLYAESPGGQALQPPSTPADGDAASPAAPVDAGAAATSTTSASTTP